MDERAEGTPAGVLFVGVLVVIQGVITLIAGLAQALLGLTGAATSAATLSGTSLLLAGLGLVVVLRRRARACGVETDRRYSHAPTRTHCSAFWCKTFRASGWPVGTCQKSHLAAL